MTDYNKQAEDFLSSTNTIINIEFIKNDYHFLDDKEKRDIYTITIERLGREISFNFGNSILNSGKYIFYSKDGKITSNDRQELVKQARRQYGYGGIETNKDFKEPNAYDILATITKHDPEDLENFCSEFDFNEDSRKAEKLYHAVKDEYMKICSIWNEKELERLRDIN